MNEEQKQLFDEGLMKLSDALIVLGQTMKTITESVETMIGALPDECKAVIDHGR